MPTAGKARVGAVLGSPVLRTEGRVTLIDGILATAVLLCLRPNAAAESPQTGMLRQPGPTAKDNLASEAALFA